MTKKNIDPQINNDKVASEIIETEIPKFLVDSYKQYISYITGGRVLCNHMDGFLNIYRRALFAAHNVCRYKYTKCSRLCGEIEGKYSPHSGSYTSVISLISNGFIDIQGSGENNFGVEYASAAAARYIEVKLNEIAEILFLNNDLLPYVDYNLSELSTADDLIYEPLWLPVLVPGMYCGIKYSCEFESYMEKGVRPVYPRYAVLTILNYILNYLEKGQFNKDLVYYQYHNMYKKCDNDMDQKFDSEFKCAVELDDEDNIHIKAKPPFINMVSKLKNIPYTDLTSTCTDIVFHKKYYDANKMKSLVKFNCLAYKMIDNDYKNVLLKKYSLQYSIITILDNLKNILFPRYFDDKINKTKELINEYLILKSAHDKYVNQKIPYDQMNDNEKKVLGKHRATSFVNINNKLNELNNILNTYINRSKNIDKEILNLYINAKDRTLKYMNEYWKEENVKYFDVTNL